VGDTILEGDAGDAFGYSLSLSDSGMHLVVGAPSTSVNATKSAKAKKLSVVHIYDFTGNEFSEFECKWYVLCYWCSIFDNLYRVEGDVCEAGTTLIYEDTFAAINESDVQLLMW